MREGMNSQSKNLLSAAEKAMVCKPLSYFRAPSAQVYKDLDKENKMTGGCPTEVTC